VADPSNVPQWPGIVLEVQTGTHGPLRQSGTFTSVAEFLGQILANLIEVTSH
jgi:hypothetical protein